MIVLVNPFYLLFLVMIALFVYYRIKLLGFDHLRHLRDVERYYRYRFWAEFYGCAAVLTGFMSLFYAIWGAG